MKVNEIRQSNKSNKSQKVIKVINIIIEIELFGIKNKRENRYLQSEF